jgi:carboxyl-terminal processing protease
MSLIEATLKIRGPKGTVVNLTILRNDSTEPFEIQIVRDEIKLESVLYEMRDNIAYIKITRFQKSTGKDLHNALKDITSKGAQGVVLDLCNNPGGVLDAAVDVASEFLAMGIVAEVIDNKGNRSSIPVRPGGAGTKLHLIVLVNKGSASASEIVAGALQDYGRAKLAGSKTFGKGSVQMVRELKDGSALHITAYRWLTPRGNPIDGVGLTPDFVLDLEGDQLIDWAIEYLKNLIKSDCEVTIRS